VVILALCVSIGVHWAALQSVAWATMIVEYSQHTSLAQAVAQTFDAEHPCGLCKNINAAQRSQKKNDAQPISVKPDLICATRVITLLPRCRDFLFASFEVTASPRRHSPPTPPPRSELA
jgi:hypothetical protein